MIQFFKRLFRKRSPPSYCKDCGEEINSEDTNGRCVDCYCSVYVI